MKPSSCILCGAILTDVAKRCPHCGATVCQESSSAHTEIDPRDQRIRELLTHARECQHRGDLTAAIRTASKALAIRAECSAIHALLGQLYEQAGDLATARIHYRAALGTDAVHTPAPDKPAASVPFVERPVPGRWMTLMVVGCILISGLATLVSFWPAQQTRNGSMLPNVIARPSLPSPPRWTWEVPKPVPSTPTTDRATPLTPDKTVYQANTRTVQDPPPPSPVAVDISTPQVLGPSAHARIPVEAMQPTLEQADQAYFRGEYEYAITVYEEVLHQEPQPNPRVFQDLAWCYQHLGNSRKAAEHLQSAVVGYQTILAKEPQNSAAHQGVNTCQAALRSLLETRTGEKTTAP